LLTIFSPHLCAQKLTCTPPAPPGLILVESRGTITLSALIPRVVSPSFGCPAGWLSFESM
ncbi:MAG: hypothetical protein WEB58_07480, partial [Planctomycetaceae bacterium]